MTNYENFGSYARVQQKFENVRFAGELPFYEEMVFIVDSMHRTSQHWLEAEVEQEELLDFREYNRRFMQLVLDNHPTFVAAHYHPLPERHGCYDLGYIILEAKLLAMSVEQSIHELLFRDESLCCDSRLLVETEEFARSLSEVPRVEAEMRLSKLGKLIYEKISSYDWNYFRQVRDVEKSRLISVTAERPKREKPNIELDGDEFRVGDTIYSIDNKETELLLGEMVRTQDWVTSARAEEILDLNKFNRKQFEDRVKKTPIYRFLEFGRKETRNPSAGIRIKPEFFKPT